MFLLNDGNCALFLLMDFKHWLMLFYVSTGERYIFHLNLSLLAPVNTLSLLAPVNICWTQTTFLLLTLKCQLSIYDVGTW